MVGGRNLQKTAPATGRVVFRQAAIKKKTGKGKVSTHGEVGGPGIWKTGGEKKGV